MSTGRAELPTAARADAAPGSGPFAVELVYCPPAGPTDLCSLEVEPGTTLAQALAASGLLERHALKLDGLRLGIWGKLKEASTVLRARDRIEIYRPLLVDPKEARRQRYGKHKLAQEARKAKAAAP